MYRIQDENEFIMAYADDILYIKQSSNGSFIEAKKEDALGISLNSIPYHLIGRPEMTGTAGEVSINEVDGGQVIFTDESKLRSDIDYIAMCSDIDLDEAIEDEPDEMEEEVNENE